MTDQIVALLNTLSPIVALLVGTGLAVKYLPWLKWFPNEGIRILNALIVFFGALGGMSPAPAHAGILGDIAQQFGLFGKVGASIVVSGMASWFYERYLRDPLSKLGLKKA